MIHHLHSGTTRKWLRGKCGLSCIPFNQKNCILKCVKNLSFKTQPVAINRAFLLNSEFYFLFFLLICNIFFNSKLFYDIPTSFLFMALSLFFIKSFYIFNEIDHNLKCSAFVGEFVLKGVNLTKKSRKI